MSNTNTQATSNTEVKRYKKTVLEMYVQAVEGAVSSKKTQQQVSASGNDFSGLNNVILATVKGDKGFKSNQWFSEKQATEAGLMKKDEDNFGTTVFTTKLVDVEGQAKKETVLRYWNVFNLDELEAIPV